jgi:hypothetical protein
MERRKSRKPMNESERRRHGRTLPNPENKNPERRANFDRWLDNQLREAYDFVREEPLPPKLQHLMDRIRDELDQPDAGNPESQEDRGQDEHRRHDGTDTDTNGKAQG